MSIDDIRALRNAQPFMPFDIFTNDGRIVRVVKPHCIGFSGTGRIIGVYEDADTPIFIEVTEVRSLHVPGAAQPVRDNAEV
jgi:hypothetical protein